jgi:hypothetical protein
VSDPTPPPLSEAERAAAAEPHLIVCPHCGRFFEPDAYAGHLEDEHARGAGPVLAPPGEPSLRRDLWDLVRYGAFAVVGRAAEGWHRLQRRRRR